jgi:hypothetical protein
VADKTSIIVPNVTVLGANLFKEEVDKFNPEKSYFNLWGAFPKSQLEQVTKEIFAACGIPSFNGIDKKPLKDGGLLKEDGSRRYGSYGDDRVIFSAKSKFRPGALLKGKDKKQLLEEDVYPGAVGAALLRPYSWQKQGNKGVSLMLMGFWLQAKGPVLEIGGSNATEEFESAASSLTFEDIDDAKNDLF